MERFHSNVGSAQRSLQERPEVFHSVDVHLSANVSLGLVDHVMHKSSLHPVVVSNCAVGIDRAAKLHVLENFILQSLALDVRHNGGAYLTKIAVKNAVHNR